MINGKRLVIELVFALVVTVGFFGGAYLVNHNNDTLPTGTPQFTASPTVAPSSSPTVTPSPTPSEGVYFVDVEYDPVTNCVTGNVVGAENLDAYRVIVFIQMTESDRELYVKPSEAGALRTVKPDGTFNVEAFTYGDIHESEDRAAKYYYLFLVPADVEYVRDIRDINDFADNGEIPLCYAARDRAVDFVWRRETGNP